MASMSLLDGLKTAQFTLQVSRTASHAYSRAAAKHKDESTDPTRGEISALVDQISAIGKPTILLLVSGGSISVAPSAAR